MAGDDLRPVIAQLRHAYAHLVADDGVAWSLRKRQGFADGLISPQIRRLEALELGMSDPAVVAPIDDATGRPRALESTSPSSSGGLTTPTKEPQ